MSDPLRELIASVQDFADAVGAWQDSDEGGYDRLIALACEAKADFDGLLAAVPVSAPPQEAEKLARDEAELAAMPTSYATVCDHYREMARRFAEDRDELKHRCRALEAQLRDRVPVSAAVPPAPDAPHVNPDFAECWQSGWRAGYQAAAVPPAQNGWQPIKTAQKDARVLAVLKREPMQTVGEIAFVYWWSGGCWTFDATGEIAEPTHWMPLPNPPASLSASAQGDGNSKQKV